MQYNHKEIEEKWQKFWAENQIFKAENKSIKPKYYVLDMFPYPSGAGLHVGHPLGYIASDIISRFKRHKGFNVLHPQGYDSFGLPAEQYAIQTGQHPEITTKENIERYRKQLDKIGFSFDWNREVRTSNSDYYKWTQWIFIQLFNSWYDKNQNKAVSIQNLIKTFESEGNKNINAETSQTEIFSEIDWIGFSDKQKSDILLNYRLTFLAEAEVNWCADLGTVLANDEVIGGVSERGGFPVVRKKMTQWIMRITAYAERLLQGLESIDWTEPLKESQRNWIGKSKGASIVFPLKNNKNGIEVFTTRPDTIFGVTFLTLAPENPLVKEITTQEYKEKVNEYIEKTSKRSERDRMSDVKNISGQFTGAYAIHPFTEEEIPIWIGDYVLAGYGTGAVMAVPCGDDRDFAFANFFKGKDGMLPIKNIFESKIEEQINKNPTLTLPQGEGTNPINKQDKYPKNTYGFLTGNPNLAKKLVKYAQEMRKEPTLCEKLLWDNLKENKLVFRFRRQHYIGNFIVDFVCLKKQLIIEVDGKIHETNKEYDSERTSILEEFGFKIIRFTNDDIENNIIFVIENIQKELDLRSNYCDELNQNNISLPLGEGQGGVLNDFKKPIQIENEVELPFTEKSNFTLQNSDFLNGLDYNQATEKVIQELEEDNSGKGKINYRLRDAVFSRQRYWGEPVPIYFKNGIPKSIPTEKLPLELPSVEKYLPTETGEPPLGRAENWAWNEQEQKIVSNSLIDEKNIFPLELNTMPGWAGSSWYWLRYMDSLNENEFANKNEINYWQNVDLYLGGSEHATGHLLYSRFWNKFLFDLNLVPTEEPFKKLINQGMILGMSAFVYRIEGTKKIISKNLIEDEKVQKIHVDISLLNGTSDELNIEAFKNWRPDFNDAEFILEDGKYICGREIEKMSKSKYNVVNPDDICQDFGADCLRLYEMFLGPLEQSKPWNTQGLSGVFGFLKKLWNLYSNGISQENPTAEEYKILHTLIKKVTEDISNFSFNTSIPAMMICINDLTKLKCNKREILQDLAIVISPYAPHICEEFWSILNPEKAENEDYKGISYESFPEFKKEYLVESKKDYPISFNGKRKFNLELSLDLTKEEVEKIVLENPETQKILQGRVPKNFIYVPGKIINLVG